MLDLNSSFPKLGTLSSESQHCIVKLVFSPV